MERRPLHTPPPKLPPLTKQERQRMVKACAAYFARLGLVA